MNEAVILRYFFFTTVLPIIRTTNIPTEIECVLRLLAVAALTFPKAAAVNPMPNTPNRKPQ
jgi:hypothetical protein